MSWTRNAKPLSMEKNGCYIMYHSIKVFNGFGICVTRMSHLNSPNLKCGRDSIYIECKIRFFNIGTSNYYMSN